MKTIFGRTFSTAAIILMLALVLVGTSFQFLVKDYLGDKAVDQLQQNAAAIAELASAYGSDGSFYNRELLVNLDVISRVADVNAYICNTKGRIIMCSDALEGCNHLNLAFNADYVSQIIANRGDVAIGVIQDLYPESRYVVGVPIWDAMGLNALGVVIISRPVADVMAVLDKLTNLFTMVSVLVVTVAFVVMTVFARHQSTPLKQLTLAARSFGHGDLNARVKLEGHHPEEMEDLALAFNNMAQELQKSEYQRQEFVANVSHELKTPMTTIAGYVDGILDGTIPQEKAEYYLRLVSDETKRLSRLVRSMLDISRLRDQGGIPEEKKSQFDLEEAAGQVLITFEQKINAKKLNVDVDMPEHPVYTFANQDYVTQVIYNLIDNAVKFCPEGKTLGLKISQGDTKAYVTVSNEGETIPPEELPLVFDRFHKLDKSRSRNRDGWGLGLYIVKTIVCSHGENIAVTSRDGRTEFTFTMPLIN